mgnify:CR=1 FL=1
MKWIFAILLVINILFFTAMNLGGSHGRETMRGHDPVKAENIKLLAESPQKADPASALSSIPAKPELCLEWGLFSGDNLRQAEQALETLQLGSKLVQYKTVKPDGYWVYITPRRTLQEAQKKEEELKKLGVPESFIIRENSKWQYAISLGIFATEEAALKFLEQLREKGVKSAVAGARNQATDVASFQIKDMSETITAAVMKLKLDFPGSELKAVECRKPEVEVKPEKKRLTTNLHE